ncbi:hypothetical protein DPMN_016071 [Dreissena polymorpha]|uniref:Thioredoxin domain-containing protein n=2 Tax=Dreissena polymorpha TaxID=45954 RepID=A0A9D4S533_DREPO|nr:hypothetical protein DPMN_016071 [Dreissena polymorpha]
MMDVTTKDFSSFLAEKKSMFFYVVTNDCNMCAKLFYTFLTASQNFRFDQKTLFGRALNEDFVGTFDVKRFPSVVYYKYGSAAPEIFDGDITTGELLKVVAKASKKDPLLNERNFALDLTEELFMEVMKTDDQFKLVMLHEAGDKQNVAMYDKLAETFQNDHSVVVARINVDFEKALKKKYNAISYPSFYWYSKDRNAKKKRYVGSANVEQMVSFINKEAGLFRTSDGKLNSFAGPIKSLDSVLKKYGKDLYDITNVKQIRIELKQESNRLPIETDKELVDFYFEILNELEEDRTVDTLTEMRNRIYRQLDGAGPLKFDQLIMKRNILNSFIDVIGMHLLGQFSDGFEIPIDINEDVDAHRSQDGLTFHEEL